MKPDSSPGTASPASRPRLPYHFFLVWHAAQHRYAQQRKEVRNGYLRRQSVGHCFLLDFDRGHHFGCGRCRCLQETGVKAGTCRLSGVSPSPGYGRRIRGAGWSSAAPLRPQGGFRHWSMGPSIRFSRKQVRSLGPFSPDGYATKARAFRVAQEKVQAWLN